MDVQITLLIYYTLQLKNQFKLMRLMVTGRGYILIFYLFKKGYILMIAFL